jgi:hypothetical protein
MYHMVHIDKTATSAHAPETLWPFVADAASWARWGPFDQASLDREGRDEPDGLGAIRRFKTGRHVSIEEVVAFEPPHWLGYTLLKGLPLRDYRADVTLVPDGQGGTTVHWRSSSRPKVPGTGWLYRLALGRFIQRSAGALAVAPEHAPRAAHPAQH